jgi:hypothetical protein
MGDVFRRAIGGIIADSQNRLKSRLSHYKQTR